MPTIPHAEALTAEERLRRVGALDLEPIVYKLMLRPRPGDPRL